MRGPRKTVKASSMQRRLCQTGLAGRSRGGVTPTSSSPSTHAFTLPNRCGSEQWEAFQRDCRGKPAKSSGRSKRAARLLPCLSNQRGPACPLGVSSRHHSDPIELVRSVLEADMALGPKAPALRPLTTPSLDPRLGPQIMPSRGVSTFRALFG